MSTLAVLLGKIKSLLCFLKFTQDEKFISDGLKDCRIAIRRINKKIKSAKKLGEKQNLLASLGHVKSYRSQFKTLLKRGFKQRRETARERVHWDDSTSAFESRIRTGIISNLKHKDPREFLKDCETIFHRRILNALKQYEAVKVNMAFCGEFAIKKADQVITEYKYITTSNSPIYRNTNVQEWYEDKVMKPIMTELSEFQERDSGWALVNVINLGVNINKFTLQLGSSYIDLPSQIKAKKACVNVNNDDDACFAWAVISALYPVEKDPQRIYKYPHYSEVLKLKGVQFPMTMKQIPNFEKQNEISVNVYILEKKKKFITEKKKFMILPSYLTKSKLDKHVNLLLIQDDYDIDDETPVHYHYVWIKNLSRLVSSQLSKEEKQKFICDRCLHYFRSEDKLREHVEVCVKMNKTAIRMPNVGENKLKFKNYKNKAETPFIIYADIESVLKPIAVRNKFQHHLPAAVGFYFKCSYDDSRTRSFYRSYRGSDCMEWFARELKQLSKKLETVFLHPYDLDITPQQEISFRKATHCHICEKPLNDDRVRDHNHFLAEKNYRGPAHNECNINYQNSHAIPVVFHNLSNYDGVLIIEDMATKIGGRIDLLPVTKEKYISFTKHIDDCLIQFRFIDSYRFLASSLDTLASCLKVFPNLKSQFPEVPDCQFRLLTEKGMMPYDYIDSFERFAETQLPSIESFYNKLDNKPCPRRKYLQAVHIWDKFGCENLGEYVDLYMKTDIMLLTDVFEQFRKSCLETYALDPAYYFTLPGFTWDCMLYKTGQELELLTDIDQLMFVEKGIRGGLSQCTKRRVKSNNKYLPNYDSSQPETYLMYYDINNQYGWAMSQYLPYGGFVWVDPNIDVTSIPDDSNDGYILEVDLEYPHSLHDLHKDLPFCPEHFDSKTRKSCTTSNPNVKLMATLYRKEKYVIHYRNLKQALENGLVLTKIYRVLKFKQSLWLKSYIDLNTELRKKSKYEFEKNLFKLMNNAVFGKTMENVRRHSNVKLVNKWLGRYGAEAWISKPAFKSCSIFSEQLVAIELHKLQIYFNKPIYVGMAILDISKTRLYDFHYGYMMNEFGTNCNICYGDTDSLIYEIQGSDPYEVMKRDSYMHFDTSDFPADNLYGIPQVNKKVIGLMKDENNGVPMTDFIGLRSKLYSLKTLTSEDEMIREKQKLRNDGYEEDEIDVIIDNMGLMKKAKGVKKSVVHTKITFEDYEDCLENFREMSVTQNLISSDKLQMYTKEQEKVALSPHDDKRYLIPGSYDTLPFGHYSLAEEKMFCE